MSQCAVCGKPLLTPLDTFGPVDCFYCQSCWLESVDDPWPIELYVRETDANGITHIRKGADFDWFFAPDPFTSEE